MHQGDSLKSTAMHSFDGSNQIRIFPEYQDLAVDSQMKVQKLSTISERDSELAYQKENQMVYRSMMESTDSNSNVLKAKVVDINTMYELFQTKQSSMEQSIQSKSNLSSNENHQQKNSTLPARMRNSQFTNEESPNDISEIISSNYLNDMNSRYPQRLLAPKQTQNLKMGMRSLSAHTSNRPQEKQVTPALLLTNPHMHNHTNQRRKSTQHSVYLNTQLQYANPTHDTNLQYIASLPVYKCSFKKRCKNIPKSSDRSPQSASKEAAAAAVIKGFYNTQFSINDKNKLVVSQQLINGFRQSQLKHSKEKLQLQQSIKNSKLFNDKIDEALQVKSKEYDQKYNQFSTQSNFTSRQTRSSCENRINKTFFKVSENDKPISRTQTNFYNTPEKHNYEREDLVAPIAFSSIETDLNKSTLKDDNSNANYNRVGGGTGEQYLSVNTQLQPGKPKVKLNNLVMLYNDLNHQTEQDEDIDSNNQQTLNTESSAGRSQPAQPQQKQYLNKMNNSRTFLKLSSHHRNSPQQAKNLKTQEAELFNTQQSILETQQRIKDNLKKIDQNLKKEKDYLAKMTMIKKQLEQTKSVSVIREQRSYSQDIRITSYQPKRAKLSRAEIGKMFKTTEQIQMHKEIGLFNRITYNNFIQKDKKNKVLLKNCNYVEFYQ